VDFQLTIRIYYFELFPPTEFFLGGLASIFACIFLLRFLLIVAANSGSYPENEGKAFHRIILSNLVFEKAFIGPGQEIRIVYEKQILGNRDRTRFVLPFLGRIEKF
jgi:hypothetical protein